MPGNVPVVIGVINSIFAVPGVIRTQKGGQKVFRHNESPTGVKRRELEEEVKEEGGCEQACVF